MSSFRPLSRLLLALCACALLAACQAPTLGGRADATASADLFVPTSTAPAATTAGSALPAPVRDAVDPTDVASVRELTSNDFVVRARASERLVRAGLRALPALGAAGDQPITVHGEARVSTTRPVIQAILEDAEAADVERVLASQHAAVRRGAATELGRRGAWRPIPALIVRLDDPSLPVRAASAASLRRLTNHFFGYSARADVRRRGAAAGRWQTWWQQEGRLADDAERLARTR